MKTLRYCSTVVVLCFSFCGLILAADGAAQSASAPVPSPIQAVFDKPLYKSATWGLRVVDSDGKVLIDYNPEQNFFIGSVRKVFSVGELLNEIGPDHTYDTPVYRVGNVDSAGVLHGN